MSEWWEEREPERAAPRQPVASPAQSFTQQLFAPQQASPFAQQLFAAPPQQLWTPSPLVQKWQETPAFAQGVATILARQNEALSFQGGGGDTDGGGSFWGDILGGLGDIGKGALYALDVPRSIVASTAQELTDVFQGEGFSFTDWSDQVGRQIGFGEVVEDWGIENIWARRALGFVGDVFLDPVNYTPAVVFARGGQAARYLDDAARLTSMLRARKADDALIAGVERVGMKFAHNAGSTVTKSDVAMLNAARAAVGMAGDGSRVAAAFGGSTDDLLNVATRAATGSLDNRVTSQLARFGEEGYRDGVRLIVPGTGRLGRKINPLASSEKTIKIAPQAFQRFTPVGIAQRSKLLLRGGKVSNRTISKALGGDYTEVKSMIASRDPAVVMEGVATHASLNMGKNARQAFADDVTRLAGRLKDNLDDADMPHVMGALQGRADDMAPLGPEKMALVDDFRNQWREAVNSHVRPNDVSGVTGEEMLGLLNGDLVGDLETWSPLKFRDDAAKLLDELGEERASQLFKGARNTVDPRNAPAKIKDGETFMGVELVKASADPAGRTPVQQANDIFADRIAEQGLGSVDALFDDDFVRSVHAHALWQAENVGRERTIRELAARGIGTKYTPFEDFAAARALGADGRRKVDSLKAAKRAQKARRRKLESRSKAQVRKGQKAVKPLQKALQGREKEVARWEKVLDDADKAGRALDTKTGWRETAEGIEAAQRLAVRKAQEAADLLDDAALDTYAGDVADAVARRAAAVKALETARRYNDEVFGEMERVRRRLEDAQLAVEQAYKRAARQEQAAKNFGREVAPLQARVDALSEELAMFEEAIGEDIGVWADTLDLHRRLLDELDPKIAALRAQDLRLRELVVEYDEAVNSAKRLTRGSTGYQSTVPVLTKLKNEFGLNSRDEALARLKRLQQKLIPDYTEYRYNLQLQLDMLTDSFATRRGVETTRHYRDLKRAVEEATQQLDEGAAAARRAIDAEPFPKGARDLPDVEAALESRPRPLANGRLGNRANDVWTPGSRMGDGVDPTDPTRFYGDVLSEGGAPDKATARWVLSRKPMEYVGGATSMNVDAIDALLRRSDFKVPKSWGGKWGRVQSRMRKNGETLEQAVRNTFGRDTDVDKLVGDLVGSTRMSAGARRAMARAHRDLAIATGHDSITFVDAAGRWHVIPLDRNAVEGLTTDLPEDTLAGLIETQQKLTDELYAGARAKELVVEELGADLESLNGRMVNPEQLAKLEQQVADRTAEIQQLMIEGVTPASRDRLQQELDKLEVVARFADERRKVEAARQAAFDGAIDAVDEEMLTTAQKIIDLEQAAAQAEAQLVRAGKSQRALDDFIERLKKVDEQDLENALKAGWKGVGVDGRIAIPNHIYSALNSGSRLMQPGGLVGTLDKVTKIWKAMAVSTVGFHVRNFIGGVTNNFSAGVEHGRYREFFKMDRAYRRALKGGKSIPEALDDVAKKYGDLGVAYGKVRTSGITAGGQFDELDFIETGARSLNPFKPNFGLYRAGRRGGEYVEEVLRGTLALDVLAKGGGMDAAINTVHKFHFDYEDLSSFERNWARRIMPFYTWTRKNLPLQLEMLVDSPKTFTRYLAVQRNLEIGTEEEGIVPHYFDKLNTIRLPWKPGGDQLYLSPDLPFTQLTQMTDWRSLVSSTNPVLRTPIELMADQSVFTGAPFDQRMDPMPVSWQWMAPALQALGQADKDARGNWMVTLKAQHIFNQVPFLAMANRVDPTGPRDNNRIASTLASMFLGIGARVNTAYDQSNELYRRAFGFEGAIQRAQELGNEALVEELRSQQQVAFDAANEMRELAEVGR